MKNQKAIKVLFFSTFMALSRIFILKNRKATFYVTLRFFSKSRSDVIRTRDLYVPNVALYQAEPHSDKIWPNAWFSGIRRPCQGTTDRGLEPLLTESESAVLPLHQSATSAFVLCFVQRTCYIIAKKKNKSSTFLNFFKFFSTFFPSPVFALFPGSFTMLIKSRFLHRIRS